MPDMSTLITNIYIYPSMNIQYSAGLNRVSHLYELFDIESDARYVKCLTGSWR